MTRAKAAFVLSLVLSLAAAPARAATYEIGPGDDLWSRLSSLAPGDEVIVHAGTYTQTSRFEATWAGTAEMPIVIRSADGEARPILTRDAAQNLLNVHGSHFTLRGLELTGGSHGIRMSAVDHATLEDLLIHDTADVGVSCNVSGMDCSFVTIRGCEIHSTSGTGEGLYLGCNAAACTFTDGLIERNFIHDLGGSQGDGIEIKAGSYGNVVRDNVIFDSIYPGITLYTFDPGAGRAPNVIERNLVVGAEDNGIQVTGRAIVRNNIVIGSGASGIASQSNMGTPTEVVVVYNTVVGAGDSCFRASSWDTGTGFVVANNALYCESARALRFASAHSAMVAGNVGLGAVEGTATGFTTGAGLIADLGAETAMGRVYPPAGSTLLDAADGAHTVADDFDLRPRGAMPDVGAYERDASGAPLWLAVRDFKGFGATMPGTDGGVAGDAGTMVPDTDASIAPGTDGGGIGSDAGGSTPASSGCGCRVATRGGPSTLAVALGLALAGTVLRRRR